MNKKVMTGNSTSICIQKRVDNWWKSMVQCWESILELVYEKWSNPKLSKPGNLHR